MVPCDGNFTTAIAKGNHKAGEIQGRTRQHSRLINLLGVKQIAIGCNKMDCDTAGYKKARYEEVSNEMRSMLVKVGWKKDMVEKRSRSRFLSFLSLAGWETTSSRARIPRVSRTWTGGLAATLKSLAPQCMWTPSMTSSTRSARCLSAHHHRWHW